MKYQLLWLFFFVPFSLSAQNLHERTWFFGTNGLSLNFNPSSIPGGMPIPLISPSTGRPYYNLNLGVNLTSIAVSDIQGDLQFFVQYRFNNTGKPFFDDYPSQPKVFDRNGNPFLNGKIDIYTNNGGSGNPQIVPVPGHPYQYYLFYVLNSGLFYNKIDMKLNNNLGDIVPTEKDKRLLGFGSVVGIKMTTVPGCSGVWLVMRSRTANQYYSFLIDENGLQEMPMVSEVGILPLNDYLSVGSFHGGILKASNDGRHLAAATDNGIELYDFEPCSGRLKNARIIDTLPAYGLCFSPDDSKLYASHNKYFWRTLAQGEVYQYDMHSGDPATIAASRTLVMRNPIYEDYNPWLGLFFYYTGAFGELKTGLDGKIYVSKNNDIKGDNPGFCNVYYPGPDHDPVPVPSNNGCHSGQYMQVINKPDQPGMACDPELDYLKLTDDYRTPGLLLQSDIKTASLNPPDPIAGNDTNITVCFRKEEVLIANADGACYTWDDGSREPTRTVNESGTYWVSYFQDCTHQTDTFQVTFIPLPEVPPLVYGCPGEIEVDIKNKAGDTTLLVYTLEKENSDLSYTAESNQGHTFSGLSAGDYALRVQSYGGCDTTLYIHLEEYPAPEVTASPADTTIRYGDTLQLSAYGAQSYLWYPFAMVSRPDIANPITFPLQPTQLFVVGTNAYGCRDTGYVNIDIDYSMPDLIPNAFSPNGDGINDVFKIEGITYQKILAFKIFNRFGQQVFSTNNPDSGWDGNYRGKPCDAGVYYYLVQLVYPDGREKTVKGDVVLIR